MTDVLDDLHDALSDIYAEAVRQDGLPEQNTPLLAQAAVAASAIVRAAVDGEGGLDRERLKAALAAAVALVVRQAVNVEGSAIVPELVNVLAEAPSLTGPMPHLN